MTLLIPHFFFALSSWYILTSALSTESFVQFEESQYLSLVGVIRYGIPLLFSIVSSHFISNRLTKNNLIILALMTILATFSINWIDLVEYRQLLLLSIFFLFSSFYEPVANMMAAKLGAKSGSYISINGILNLVRTSARFLGPILAGYILTVNSGLISQVSVAGLLLAGVLLGFIFLKTPTNETVSGKKQETSLVERMKQLRGEYVARSMLVIYMLFYLGVSYVEYLPLILNGSGMKATFLYTSLGGGFLLANLGLTFYGKKITNPVRIFVGSLLVTGVSISLMPFFPIQLVPYVLVFVGIANALSVSVSSALFQKYLPRNQLGLFVGVLSTATSLAALISLGLGWLVSTYIGYQYVFVVNGLFIMSSSLFWIGSYRRFQSAIES